MDFTLKFVDPHAIRKLPGLAIQRKQPAKLVCPNKAGVLIFIPIKNLPLSTLSTHPELWSILLVKMGNKLNLPGGDVEIRNGIRETAYACALRELGEEVSQKYVVNNVTKLTGIDFHYSVSHGRHAMRVFVAIGSPTTKNTLSCANNEVDGVELLNLRDVLYHLDLYRRRLPPVLHVCSRVLIAVEVLFGKYV